MQLSECNNPEEILTDFPTNKPGTNRYETLYDLLCSISRFDREANTDAEVNGVFVPKGVTVIALAYAIHYNSKYWPEPEKYNPDR